MLYFYPNVTLKGHFSSPNALCCDLSTKHRQLLEVVPLIHFHLYLFFLSLPLPLNLTALFFPADVKASLLAEHISQPSASPHVGVIICSFGVSSPPLPESSSLRASAMHLNTSPSD